MVSLFLVEKKKTPLTDILITIAFMFKIIELENYIYIKLDFLKSYEIISEKFISVQCILFNLPILTIITLFDII